MTKEINQELLEALKGLINEASEGFEYQQGCHPELEVALDVAQKAIAKAEGK